jgi:glycosyltransferase involved in cell wall biosynthesis
LKLLVITNTLGESQGTGSAVFCDDLIARLKKSHKLTVIATGHVPEGVKVSDEVVRIDTALAVDPEELLRILIQHVQTKNYDLVYNLGGLQFGCTVAGLLRSLGDIPLVNHFQAILGSYANIEGLAPDLQELNSAIQRDAAQGALLNIFISDAELHHAALSGFDLGGSEVAIVPNGVDPSTLKNLEDETGFKQAAAEDEARPIIFATAGRFSDYVKGGDLVYRAFSYLYGLRQDVRLLSITDSRRFTDVLDALPAESYQVENWLTRRQFLARMASADVVVVPSRYEAFGLVALEAMMLGKPVVAMASGGLQTVVEHGRTGLLCAPGEGSFGLFQAMRTLADSSPLRQHMGQAGRERALREYTISRVADLMESNLKRALLHHRSFARAGIHV